MNEPLRQGSAQLFSAMAYGLGEKNASITSTLGRFEWLAFELVAECREILLEKTT